MSVNYYKKMGKMIIAQGENEFEISIWTSNCVACFNYEWTDENGDGWIRLYHFFMDEKHMKNMNEHGGLFPDDVKSIYLDTSFPEARKLARLLKKFGYTVNTDYHQPE